MPTSIPTLLYLLLLSIPLGLVEPPPRECLATGVVVWTKLSRSEPTSWVGSPEWKHSAGWSALSHLIITCSMVPKFLLLQPPLVPVILKASVNSLSLFRELPRLQINPLFFFFKLVSVRSFHVQISLLTDFECPEHNACTSQNTHQFCLVWNSVHISFFPFALLHIQAPTPFCAHCLRGK